MKAGHIELLVTSLSTAMKFYAGTLGFIVTKEVKGRAYMRGLEDRKHHSLLLTEAERPGVGHIAFRVADEASLTDVKKELDSRGCWSRWRREGEEAGVGRALVASDPFGFPVEFYAEMEEREWMLQKYEAYRGAKVMRLDHFNLMLPDVAAAYEWYTKTLGFVCTELTETEGARPDLWAAWLRRKHTCHDVALTTGKGPRVHHAGFTVADRGAIMDCADLLASTGHLKSMERGPGRHGVSNAFFLYLRDPDGNRIELYTGDYLSSDPDWKPIRWKLNDPQRQTFWGAPTPASWFNEAMAVRSPKRGGLVKLSDPRIQDRPDYLLSER